VAAIGGVASVLSFSTSVSIGALGDQGDVIVGQLIAALGYLALGAWLAAGRSHRFVGWLMMGVGWSWGLGFLIHARTSLWLTVVLVSWALPNFMAHLVASYPDRRIEPVWRWFVVAAVYVLPISIRLVYVFVTPDFANTLDEAGAPMVVHNLLLVTPDAALAKFFNSLAQGVWAVAYLGVALLLFRRRLTATQAARRSAALFTWIGIGACVVWAGIAIASLFLYRTDSGQLAYQLALLWVLTGIVVLTAIGYDLFVRRQIRHAAFGQVVVRIADDDDAVSIQDALAEWLGDPELFVLYRNADESGWVTSEGHRSAPAGEDFNDRRGVPVIVDDREVARVLVDAAIDPELVRPSVAALSLGLHNQALLALTRAQMEEVAASRRRLLDAADNARRHVQESVAATVVAPLLVLREGLVRLRTADSGGVPSGLAAAVRQVQVIAENLRKISHGLYPTVIDDLGLVAALRTLADGRGIRIEMGEEAGYRRTQRSQVDCYFILARLFDQIGRQPKQPDVGVRVDSIDGESRLIIDLPNDGEFDLRPVFDRLAAARGTAVWQGSQLIMMIPDHGAAG
jgi:hypothetical protein